MNISRNVRRQPFLAMQWRLQTIVFITGAKNRRYWINVANLKVHINVRGEIILNKYFSAQRILPIPTSWKGL